MKKNLLSTAVGSCLLILFCATTTHAQIKGNPSLKVTTLQPPGTPKVSSKLSPDLKNLYDNSSSAQSNAKAVQSLGAKPLPPNNGLDKYMQIKGDKVVVDVTAKGDVNAAKTELQKMGFEVKAVFGRVISGIISISSLPQLEAATNVRFARPAYKPMHLSNQSNVRTFNFGGGGDRNKITPVISQGDTAQRSYIARKKYNVSGKGVKVGVISDSYNNLGGADVGVAHGELPGPTNPFGYKKPVQVLEDLDGGGTDEGRAMTEIVHDVAPGADLAFHTADFGQADFAQGIQDLANAGCNVINDDVFYYAEPFFQDGIIAQSVDLVKKRGVTYFSSAGNSSIRSYESDYRPSTYEPFGDGFGTAHNFSSPSDPAVYYQPLYIPSGGSIISSFQWDQSFFSASGVGCETDFDVYLVDIYGNIVAGGASDNIASGDPVEVFGYYNDTQNYTFFLVIVKYAGPDVSRLKYILYNDALFYLTDPPIPGILAPTIVGHTKAEGAISTGAAWYLNTPAYGLDTPYVEYFSSVGGVANYYDIAGNRIAPLIRNKPEIVAPDGGNTSFFDPFGNGDIPQDSDTFPNFFGTSAAAPHAAGVAALMIEAQKLRTITPDQIKGILESKAIDMDNIYTDGFDVGFDYNTGYGFIKADAAVGEVKFPNSYIKNLKLVALCSPDPSTTRNWKIINPNPFEVDVNWFVTGFNQNGTLQAAPGETTFSTNTATYRNYQVPNIVVINWEDNFGFTRFDAEASTRATCGKDAVSASMSDASLAKTATEESASEVSVADVYPNPSSKTFRVYLSLAGQQNVSIQLFSVDGKKLTEKVIGNSKGIVELDATRYAPGVYWINVKQGAFNKTIKVIRQ
ncbi:MAG TPA: S8 family serine peptidase [Puia sp.]|nr:S8 family serine peptidase [Puia sp.]